MSLKLWVEPNLSSGRCLVSLFVVAIQTDSLQWCHSFNEEKDGEMAYG